MNSLEYLFAHNAWATDRLLEFCEGLSEEQLAATAGAVDGVLRTLQHYVQAEGGYYTRLVLDRRPEGWDRPLAVDFAVVRTPSTAVERRDEGAVGGVRGVGSGPVRDARLDVAGRCLTRATSSRPEWRSRRR